MFPVMRTTARPRIHSGPRLTTTDDAYAFPAKGGDPAQLAAAFGHSVLVLDDHADRGFTATETSHTACADDTGVMRLHTAKVLYGHGDGAWPISVRLDREPADGHPVNLDDVLVDELDHHIAGFLPTRQRQRARETLGRSKWPLVIDGADFMTFEMYHRNTIAKGGMWDGLLVTVMAPAILIDDLTWTSMKGDG